MPARNFLAFDLGAESGRAVLGTLESGKLSLSEKHRFPNPNGRMNGHLQWDLLGQWEQLKEGLRRTATPEPGSKKGLTLHGIGVDTWGVDFGLVGRDGQILGNPFHYRDSRTDGVMEKTFRRVGREKIFDVTGIQFMKFNSLFQLLAMKEANSPMLEIAQTLLFVPDLFNYLFTGQRKSEFSIATTSQMYDPKAKAWAKSLLKQLDLPVSILPEIVPSGTVIGPLLKDVAVECGVTSDIPVIAPATHDTGSAVAAVPVTPGDDSWCYVSSGTWSLMGVELDEPLINDKSLKYNYTNEGGVGGTTRFLKNIMGLWLVQECRRAWQREGHDHTYVELTQMAARAKGLGAVIDPAYDPFVTPGDMPAKIERFCKETKQKAPNTRGEFVRACLEGLA
ncbi:MAG: rhamnulokinase, partial [Tepidisphaeraceae bacterium]